MMAMALWGLVADGASAPWWNEYAGNQIGAWTGAGVGVLGAAYGSSAGYLATKGRARNAVLGVHLVSIALGILMLAAAIAALVLSQPFHVWYPLALPGAILTLVMGILLPVMRARYAQAEQRKLEAAELRRALR
jgi:hypothetical protein